MAGWLRDPRWSFQGVLAAGPRGCGWPPRRLRSYTWSLPSAWRRKAPDRATLNRRYGGHARSRLTAFLLDNVTNVEELTS